MFNTVTQMHTTGSMADVYIMRENILMYCMYMC